MKYIYTFLVCMICTMSFAQKQTFDLYTYVPPKGYTKEVTDASINYTYIDKKDKSWCQIGVFKSTDSKGNLEDDFASEWQILVAAQYKTNEPQFGDAITEVEGWKIKTGYCPFIFNNTNAIAILTTFSGNDISLSIVAIFNDEKYIDDIQELIVSIELNEFKKNNEVGTFNNQNNNVIVTGSWGKSNSVSQLYNRYGTYSYNKQQYFFNANGTYTFLGKNYSENYAETLLIRESGSYSVSGNQITIEPKNCVIESWSKKNGADNWGQLKSSQKMTLEKVTYNVNQDGENLNLSTVSETIRDGRFSNGNNYSYGPPHTFTAIILPEK